MIGDWNIVEVKELVPAKPPKYKDEDRKISVIPILRDFDSKRRDFIETEPDKTPPSCQLVGIDGDIQG